jgi:eukaryotic-like serine/threonine-protein kinase
MFMKYPTGGFGSVPSIEIDKKIFGELEEVAQWATVKKSDRDVFWGIKTGGSIDCIPIIHDGVVYFGACDHIFYALDAETGEEVWRFKTNGPLAGDKAALADGVVYFGSFDGVMYAVSAKDGKEIWRFDTNSKLFNQVVHKGVLYFGSKAGVFYALDAKTGRELWRFHTKGSIMTPCIYDDRVYFGSWDHNLYAMSLDGRLLWKFTAAGQVNWGIVADKQAAYFGSGDHNLYAVSHEGKLLWKFRTNGAVISTPFVSEDAIYFSSYDQNLYSVSKSGNFLWKFETGNILYACPIVHGGRIYFGACDKNFYALGLDGSLLWKVRTNEYESHGPAALGDKIYFCAWDCKLRCVSAKNGKVLWEFKTSIGHPSECDVDSELGEATFELIVHEPSEDKTEKKYKEARNIDGTEEYESSGIKYKTESGYRAKGKYGA